MGNSKLAANHKHIWQHTEIPNSHNLSSIRFKISSLKFSFSTTKKTRNQEEFIKIKIRRENTPSNSTLFTGSTRLVCLALNAYSKSTSTNQNQFLTKTFKINYPKKLREKNSQRSMMWFLQIAQLSTTISAENRPRKSTKNSRESSIKLGLGFMKIFEAKMVEIIITPSPERNGVPFFDLETLRFLDR